MIPKFRVWDKHVKKIRKVTEIHFDDSLIYLKANNGKGYYCSFSDIVLMQSTSLKDKNGVEIFEGDIVKVSVHNGFDYYDNEVCVVRKSRFHSGLVCINPNNDMECRIFNQDVLEDYQYEVIGNIYENPELLEVE